MRRGRGRSRKGGRRGNGKGRRGKKGRCKEEREGESESGSEERERGRRRARERGREAGEERKRGKKEDGKSRRGRGCIFDLNFYKLLSKFSHFLSPDECIFDLNFCELTNEPNNDDFDWSLGRGTERTNTGPTKDQSSFLSNGVTSGWFLFVFRLIGCCFLLLFL